MAGNRTGLMLAAILFTGGVMNFLWYWPDGGQSFESSSTWRDIRLLPAPMLSVSRSLDRLLQIESADGEEEATDQISDEVFQRFSYGGVTYRLSGLVTGTTPAATLIGTDGEPVRLEPGDTLPSGEKIVSIKINEIHLENRDGEIDAVEIY